jgi:hypothetical protein
MSAILYHYTSMATLQAILENITDDYLTLRATEIRYLNDAKEYKLALNILRELLIEYDESTPNKKNLKLKLSIERMGFLKEKNKEIGPPFVFSLSKERDSLPMWNTYGDSSLGIAIGFKKNELSNMQYGHSSSLEKCIYDYEKVKETLRSKIRNIHSSIFFNDSFVGVISGLDSDTYTFFESIVSSFKHNSFEYEKEWRLIFKQTYDFDKLNFNVKNGLPKPYIEVPLKTEVIEEIVVGPCANFDLVKHSLFRMLKKAGLNPAFDSVENSKIKITQSKCPFRII